MFLTKVTIIAHDGISNPNRIYNGMVNTYNKRTFPYCVTPLLYIYGMSECIANTDIKLPEEKLNLNSKGNWAVNLAILHCVP